jgi:chromosome segregation ATPase
LNPVKFEDESEPGPTRRPAFNWRYSAIPLCLFALWLVSPEDKGPALEKQLAGAQSELAAVKSELVSTQRAAHDASAKARSASDTVDEQTRMLEEERRRAETLTHDLTGAQQIIEDLKAKAVLADDARLADEASLAKALEEAGRKVELSELEVTRLRQASNASKTSADAAALQQAKALRGQAVAEAALKAANDSLELERARAASTTRDLEKANQERDAAKQLSAVELSVVNKERDAAKQRSAELTAALEQQRQKLAGMAVELSAAHNAFADIITQSDRCAADLEQFPKVRAAASAPTNLPGRPARQPRVGGKQNPEPRRSRRVLETTITLPDALLPILPSTR